MSIRIVIADDQALIRAGFRSILEREGDFVVVGEAVDGVDAVALVRRTKPDVILMDIRMPRLDGIAATQQICADESLAATRVIIITTYEIDEYIYSALRAGASAFLLKNLEPDELRKAVSVVAGGESLLAPSVTRRIIEQFSGRPTRSSDYDAMLAALTERERQIVGLVGQGLSNVEISAQLSISTATAKTHVTRAMMKLGCRDRAQLVVFAYESGTVVAAGP
jgi:DNA-binding NarL/FixJ family response regulator